MRHLILILSFLFLHNTKVIGQGISPEKIKKYCVVEFYPAARESKRVLIHIGSLGIKDSTDMKTLVDLNDVNNEVNLLDVMSAKHWKILFITPIFKESYYTYIKFYFEKEFKREELN